MRTDDFSGAPDIGRAGAMFVGGTRCTSPMAWARHARPHRAMVAALRRMRGYRGHRTYWQPPFTLGTIAWFDTVEDLMRFARSGAHRELLAWVVEGTGNGTGGWIRVYAAQPQGYTNGVWRAEGHEMAHIDTFTPIGREAQGPPVRRGPRSRSRTGDPQG